MKKQNIDIVNDQEAFASTSSEQSFEIRRQQKEIQLAALAVERSVPYHTVGRFLHFFKQFVIDSHVLSKMTLGKSWDITKCEFYHIH